jgi:hypothetical protein
MRADTFQVYSTPHIIGKDPFFVRTDTYSTPINKSITTAKQRTFPIIWNERSRIEARSWESYGAFRALNGSDGKAAKDGAAVRTYGNAGSQWIWGIITLVMAITLLG